MWGTVKGQFVLFDKTTGVLWGVDISLAVVDSLLCAAHVSGVESCPDKK